MIGTIHGANGSLSSEFRIRISEFGIIPCRIKPHQGKVFFNSEFSIPHSELTYKSSFSAAGQIPAPAP